MRSACSARGRARGAEMRSAGSKSTGVVVYVSTRRVAFAASLRANQLFLRCDGALEHVEN